MLRNIDLNDISDGRYYGLNDMVKVGCHDCEGCSACCQNMGDSIKLDPYDIHRLSQGLGQTFEEMLDQSIELHIVDGMILPNLKMAGERPQCTFLDYAGRCSIHPYRPGFCRIFPLARVYENRDFKYILQIAECHKQDRYDVRLKHWIDTPEPGKNAKFINDWHYFLKDIGRKLTILTPKSAAEVRTYVLKLFYAAPYHDKLDFYGQFDARMRKAREALAALL